MTTTILAVLTAVVWVQAAHIASFQRGCGGYVPRPTFFWPVILTLGVVSHIVNLHLEGP